ncbi:Sulfotransferase family protein [Monaibacterium marinum]|uniref:Sulfotransferase family protein n=1 Tax=Pontivivens marinum TaxID=1690039 RepID=A0A2C9CYA9_9RHOB|nr:sulfotransferase [Monaibacterium marinum]SOH95439.1 Sulfotransferase family protein [Monaibacterium marinum]
MHEPPTPAQLEWIPNLFIAGAPKAGTSSVHQWIAAHPDATGSREKETYFLVDPGTHMHRPQAHIRQGYESWRDQFAATARSSAKVIVESTPGYMYSATAKSVIPALANDAKCLFILREPSQQIYSLYNYFHNNWNWIPDHMDFATFVDAARAKTCDFNGNELAQNALENAAYIHHLREWRQHLGPNRMMVRNFDEVRQDQGTFIKDVAQWVGLSPDFYESYDFPHENETYMPASRKLQKLNVAVRHLLPQGAAYNRLRSLYRTLNTSNKTLTQSATDTAVLAELRAEFRNVNEQLSAEFGIHFE